MMNCQPAKGCRNKAGYGYSHGMLAHRWAYIQANGEIPSGMCVRHTCDNPSCINPEHLILGTHSDNMKDKVERNRQSRLFGKSNGNCKLTSEQIEEIRQSEDKQIRLAERYGVSKSLIGAIVRGERRA